MSRSRKLPILVDKNPWHNRYTPSSILRKRTKMYINSHIYDDIDVAYMSSIPIQKDILHNHRFIQYKYKYIKECCGVTQKTRRICANWKDGIPLYMRSEICENCRKFNSRK